MIPTDKEKSLINKEFNFKLGAALIFTILLSFVFAKSFEYHPILISYRSITAGTAYQPSTARFTAVSIPVQVACTSTLAGGASGATSLQICSTSGGAYTTISQITNANTVSLAIAITVTNTNGETLQGIVPAGWYYKVVNTTTTGTPVFTILNNSQETNL